jgi:alpha-N-arabinofuranosidase
MPVIDAVATVDGAGKNWVIAMVNRHPSETVACTVKLGDRSLDGTFDATILAGDSPEAYNDVEQPGRIVPERKKLTFTKGTAKLPPHSLTIVRLAAP